MTTLERLIQCSDLIGPVVWFNEEGCVKPAEMLYWSVYERKFFIIDEYNKIQWISEIPEDKRGEYETLTEYVLSLIVETPEPDLVDNYAFEEKEEED